MTSASPADAQAAGPLLFVPIEQPAADLDERVKKLEDGLAVIQTALAKFSATQSGEAAAALAETVEKVAHIERTIFGAR